MRLAQHLIAFFRNVLNKLNNTGARMLYFVSHMTLKLDSSHVFG